MSAAPVERALRGDRLRMGFAAGARVWWFDDPYEEIEDADIGTILAGPNGGPRYVEAGDCLFGWPGNSQTWVSIYAE